MGRMGRVVGGVETALLNRANTTSTASRAPASNCAISGSTNSAAWAALGLSPMSTRCDATGRFANLKNVMPFLPTMCSCTVTPSPSSSSMRCRASRIRLALNAPHSPRFDVIRSRATRWLPAVPFRGWRSSGNRSANSGE